MARNMVNVGHHHLRSVFVWVPEQTHPRGLQEGRPPCPRCKTTRDVVVKGWTQKLTRRAVLRGSCCDLLDYFYTCRDCGENNKGKPKVGCFSACAVILLSFGAEATDRAHNLAQAADLPSSCLPPSSSCACHLQNFPARVAESFQGWDAGVLSQLPFFVQDLLLFFLQGSLHFTVT